jgi:TIR domain
MYDIFILHDGEDLWAGEVSRSVREAADGIGVPSESLRVVDVLPGDGKVPAVVVYLANHRGAARADFDATLRRATAAAHTIVPVHRAEQDVFAVMPDAIKRLNAVDWTAGPRSIALLVLRAIGIAEEERRLFLSYRRSETSGLALQLHRALVERRWDVFLDRFSVECGADFQERIHIDLADKAFVLLLESPEAHSSRWVEEEVAYAMSHRISHLALSLPDTPPDLRFPTVDDAFRYELDLLRDFAGESGPDAELTHDSLRRILDEIEVRYAKLYRRRREQLLGSLIESLEAGGYEVAAAGDWALLAQAAGSAPRIYLTTPRAPTPRDLHSLDRMRATQLQWLPEQVDAVVAHPVADLDATLAELVEWIAQGRRLSTTYMGGGGLSG